jgi:hypothetical protein
MKNLTPGEYFQLNDILTKLKDKGSISEKKQIDILNTSGLSKRKDGEWVTPEGHVVFLKN